MNHSDFLDQEHQVGSRSASSLPHVELEIVRGRAEYRRRPVTVPAFLIGSAPDCDLVLAEPKFPDVHAYFRLTESGVVVRHLGFAPLLRINGRPTSSAQLQHGDRITTGPFEFVLHVRPPEIDRLATRAANHAPLPFGFSFDGPGDPFEATSKLSDLMKIEPRTRTSVLRLYIERDRNGSGRLSSG